MALSITTSTRARPIEPRPSGSASALGWCLVTSGDDRIRQILLHAAHEGGWHARACRTPDEALREAVLHRVPLALVDIGSVEDRTKHADMMRIVRGSSNGLVVVCDRDSNAEGELWARQEGAWVYLSGVSEASDVTSVCVQAREIFQAKQTQIVTKT